MSEHDEKRQEQRPPTGEAPFGLDEVFFSRTDARGVIQAGNYVFRRVAHYDWGQLIGAPHKIIRHPDMPKGLFRFFWDTIQRKEIVGAYVNNRSKDGLYYWVFAVIVPCDDGYLSVRIKPTSETFTMIQGLYAEQRALEVEKNLDPGESAEWMLNKLQEHGFSDYGRFMAHALTEELISRDAGLGREPDQTILQFRKMQSAADRLTGETDGLITEFGRSAIIPHNMRVIASRLESNGGPISTLSANYGEMSRQMSGWFESNVVGKNSNFSKIRSTVTKCMFMTCMSRILFECSQQLNTERRKLGEIDLEVERKTITSLAEYYRSQSSSEQHRLDDEIRRIFESCKIMNRHMLGLSTSRVMCKIESARLSHGREALTDTIAELNSFQERIRSKLGTIENLSDDIRTLLV
ncbi:chemotaxis protein [Sulfitobacter sp. LCG007]